MSISILDEHVGYLALPHRLDLYRAAVAKLVGRGDHVIDVGCGTAVLGLLCLEAGASRVDAIDSTAAIELARQSLTQAGHAQKCNFIRASSFQTTLAERADVIICDHVGHFGFDYGLIEVLADARQRFLKPAGQIIPGRLKLFVSAVESRDARDKANAWRNPGIPGEFHWIHEYSVNSKHVLNLRREELLADPAELCCIDLRIDNPEFFSWSVTLTVDRDGVLHGLGGWFECELADGIWMTNSPLSDRSIGRGNAFLPIAEPLPVRARDRLDVTIMARPASGMIAWTLNHPATGKRVRHSTWQGEVFDPVQLAFNRPDHVPRLRPSATARNIVLSYCDGRRSIADIQSAVLRDHPDLFPSAAEIARFVTTTLRRDAQ